MAMAASKMLTRFKAAAVHAAPIYMNKAASIQKVVGFIEQAAKQDIKFLVFPETFIPGYPYFAECYPPLRQVSALTRYATESVVVASSELSPITTACRRANVSISLGISERIAGGHTLFNSQVLIDTDGAVLGVHRKIQPTYVERYVWAQGDGSTLRAWPVTGLGGWKVGGLACWENAMNGARQALIVQGQHVHAAAWPALSNMAGFEGVADAQIEALAKAHALSAQVYVVCASSYADAGCVGWMEDNLGPQDFVREGGGWSALVHPFCGFVAGPHTGAQEMLVAGELDLAQLDAVKVWIDAAGHYQRPEIFKFSVDESAHWADGKTGGSGARGEEKVAVAEKAAEEVKEDKKRER